MAKGQPSLLEEYFGIKYEELEYAENDKRSLKRANEIIIELDKSLSRRLDTKQALLLTAADLNLVVKQEEIYGHIIPSWNYIVCYGKDTIVRLIQKYPKKQTKVCNLHFPNYSYEHLMYKDFQIRFLKNFDKNLQDILIKNKKI